MPQFPGLALLTALHIAFRTLIWGLIGLGLALVLVMVRLDAGPIELGWLKPRIERALTLDGKAIAATTGRTELRLDKEDRTLELVGVDVRYQVMGDEDAPPYPFLIFPEVEVTLSVRALLQRGIIAASEVRANAPSLIISQSENGIVGLLSEADYDGRVDDIDFGGFLRDFALASEQDGRLAFLERLQIGGGLVAYVDHDSPTTLTAKNADLVLARREGHVEGWLRADVVQPSSAPASVQLSGRLEPDTGTIAFEADVADLMPSDLPALWPDGAPPPPNELAGISLPIRASIEGQLGLDGVLSPLKVGVQTAAGAIDLPTYLGESLEIDALTFEGTVDPGPGRLNIERATIASRGAELEASGSIVWGEDERSMQLDLAAADVRAEDLRAFWPPHLGVDARAWVLENIETGLVGTAEARLDLRPEDWRAATLRDEAIEGRFVFEGLSVRYVDEMPPLEDASGSATFDADRMDFEVTGGANAGITLNGGSVTITGMGKPGKLATQLRVLANAEGGIAEAVSILDHPPLEVAAELGIAASETAGSVTATIDVSMPLYVGVTEDEAIVLAEAELTDFSMDRLPKFGDGARLDRGAFGLVVEEEAVQLEGTAEINGVPLAIDVVETLEAETVTRRIGVAGRLDRQQRESLGIAIDALDGDVDFEAEVTETSSNLWVDFEADLMDLAIEPPGLVWEKPAGQAGVLRASIAMPVDGPIEVRNFDLLTGDLQASGSLGLTAANDRLESLAFDSFRLGDTDAAVRFLPDGEGGFDIEIDAVRLDLDALFGEDREIGDTFQRFHAILSADQILARGIELIDVTADAVHTPEGWRSASVIGSLPSGGRLALDLAPVGNDRWLQVRTDNAGALIEAFDLGRRVEGGDMQLSAKMTSQDPMIAEGRFEIDTFVLQDAPLLARMLSLASPTGIANLLGGEGMQVDHLILPFTVDDRTLAFTDGLLRGSQIGLTVKGEVGLAEEDFNLAGTIIPVYSLNRLIGQVPVIGRILTGVDGRGAFAATYSITGPQDDPTVYVNPLSMLTPGLVRDFVGGLLNGSGEPADVRETDD